MVVVSTDFFLRLHNSLSKLGILFIIMFQIISANYELALISNSPQCYCLYRRQHLTIVLKFAYVSHMP
jgi:hypothetical protein